VKRLHVHVSVHGLAESVRFGSESAVYGTDEIRPKSEKLAEAACCAPSRCAF